MKKLLMLLIVVSLSGYFMSCASSKTFPGRGFGGGGNNGTLQNGNWAFTLSNTSRNTYMGGNLVTSSTAINASLAISGDPSTGFEFSPSNPLINATGAITGSTVTLTGTYASSSIKMTFTNVPTSGTITSMTGTYTVTGGSDSGDAGNVTAEVAGDFTGTWQGTDSATGGVLSAVLSESATPSGGIFPLTASNVTFSGGTGCAVTPSGALTGFVAGGLFYLKVTTTDGGNAGTFGYFGIANDPTNPATISGSYIYTQGTSCLFQNTGQNITMTLSKQ